MDESTFWEMLSDGRLATLAKNKPMELEALYTELVEQILIKDPIDQELRRYSDSLIIKILFEAPSFEYQAVLAKEQPELFEFRRTTILNAFHRLHVDEKDPERGRRIQWRVDRERERHTNALGACVALNKMMNESMWGEGGLRDTLNMYFTEEGKSRNVVEQETSVTDIAEKSTVVVPFKPKPRS